MRAALSLTCGGPGRVAVSAAFIVCIGFVLAGHFWDLARAAWITAVFAIAFSTVFLVLAAVGAGSGVVDLPPSKEPDRG